MSKTLYFVRHATGQEPDAPLTTEGHQQAIALVDLHKKPQENGQVIAQVG